MNSTFPEEQDKLSAFSHTMEALASHGLDRTDWLDSIEQRYARESVEFAGCREEEFARMLDENQISWRYKPRTFAVEWDEEGNFVDCFTPDFYLPSLDLYVEVTGADCRTSGEKARKVRLLRGQHPEIRIELCRGLACSMFRDLL
jgi:hypothetical protein